MNTDSESGLYSLVAQLNNKFQKFSKQFATIAGQPLAFAMAIIIIIVWAFAGPIFGWTDSWQLLANTITTIITFLMVFLIQGSQNSDTFEIKEKLDKILQQYENKNTKMD